MNENQYLRKSAAGVSYLDYKDFLGIPSGILLRNDCFSPEFLDNFMINDCSNTRWEKNVDGKGSFELIKLNQKHTNIVVSAKENTPSPSDGVYTNSNHHILLVRTADCIPAFLYDGTVAGLLHLGWRSVFAGILKNFLRAVPGFNKSQAHVVIGPGIGLCCFEVSSEVFILFDKKYRHCRNDKFFIDLKRLILDELTEFGLKYILASESCTVCEKELFYSYRREGPEVKHMISYISLGG